MKTRLLLAALAVAAGCGGTSQVNITKPIGAPGGTVGTDNTSVQVPSGALTSQATITISSVDAPAPAGTVLVGSAFNFGPDGLHFASPVTITLPFDAALIPSGHTASDIHIYTAPRGSSDYTVLPATVEGKSVVTQTSHFTVYLPAVQIVSTPADLAMNSPADLAVAGPIDLARPADLATSVCTPSCSASSGECGCSETCNGHSYLMICSGTTSINCSCEIDGATQSVNIQVSSCLPSNIESAFQSQCAG